MVGSLQELQLQEVITAIGGLGTAAFGLVDAAKASFSFINRIGFNHIRDVVSDLTPEGASAGLVSNALSQTHILATLEANWANGNDVSNQKAIAKSLIKLHLSASNAAAVAARSNVDPDLLSAVAAKIVSGTSLTQQESDTYARFDLIVTAMLDEAYQISEQVYRNSTRMLAALVAVALSLTGGWAMVGSSNYWHTADPFLALLVGLLATPLAPIAKDLSTALATAVNALQAVKRGK